MPHAPVPLARALAKITLGMAGVGGLLCATAGTWAWGAAWLLALVTAVALAALARGLARANPGLFAARQATPFRGPDQPLWDKIAVALLFATMGLWLVIPGLDVHRLGLSKMPLGLQVFGTFVLVGGLRVMYLALIHNPNLLPHVEVPGAARLAASGPYAQVRHPYYAGFILFYAGASLLLGSWLALGWTGVIALVFAGRLVREERVLLAEMAGYADYQAQVTARLVPGLW